MNKKLDLNFWKKIQSYYKKEKKPNKGQNSKLKSFFSNLSKSFMLPIAILPLVGMVLGIGATISSNTSGDAKIFGDSLSKIGDVIFSNLAILFAVGLAIGFTKGSGVAALSAVAGYLVFNAFQSAFLVPVSNPAHVQTGWNIWFWKGLTLKSTGSALGITSLKTGVIGGIIIGGLAAWCYNKFHETKLPTILGFFAGERSVPIITIVLSILLSILFLFIWPGIGIGLNSFGKATTKLPGGLDSFVEGVGARALLPLGLHHPFYGSMWWTSAGGSLIDFQGKISINHAVEIVNGSGITNKSDVIAALNLIKTDSTGIPLTTEISKVLNTSIGQGHSVLSKDFNDWFYSIKTSTWQAEGDQKIQQAIFGDPTLKIQDVWGAGLHAGRFISGGFPLFMVGLPLIGGAMLSTIPKDKRKFAASIYVPAVATAFLTGVTEPIEFTFLFAAPWLYYVIYVPLAGFSCLLMNVFQSSISVTFSQGFFDYILYGLLPIANGHNTRAWAVPIVGLIVGIPAFFIFRYAILWKNIDIPGRGGTSVKLISKKEVLEAKSNNGGGVNIKTAKGASKGSTSKGGATTRAKTIIKGYGGKDNIISIDACATRLRIDVKNVDKVDEDILKNKTGAIGVIKAGKNIQAVYGPQVSMIKNEVLKEYNEKK